MAPRTHTRPSQRIVAIQAEHSAPHWDLCLLALMVLVVALFIQQPHP